MWITENQLDDWVRSHAQESRGLIVELVWRLVAASVPQPRERRFPLGDSIGQHGPDGCHDTDLGFEPFVPDGKSLWEIGTNLDAGDKATRDYRELTDAVPEAERLGTTFVFVTPISGTRGWEYSWKTNAQARWISKRKRLAEWKDVRVLDGTKIVDWLRQFPAVGLWLTEQIMGIPATQIETPVQRWDVIRSIGEPPPLGTQLFLANRQEAREKIAAVFAGASQQAKLDTRYPDQVIDFVCAYLADLEPEQRAEAVGRCVIISGSEAWTSLSSIRERHVLLADVALDLSHEAGTKLIQRARREGHAVIFGAPPGGVPDPTSAPLRSPLIYQIEEALRNDGYGEQRAKSLAQRSGGNLGSLLRCFQNLSLLPAWAEESAAAELTIAAVLGAWTDDSEADRAAVEQLAGNAYGEWIGQIRDAARRPGTPLVHQEGRWRFIPRFEGWYSLGPRLFDEHLDRLREVAFAVLGERDPQFELDKKDRHAASIYGKVLAHSDRLRGGLADALALLGSHPQALTSCSRGKAEATASLTVRALLKDADWTRWAELDDVLPLLAEAAPGDFLSCIDQILRGAPEVIDVLFAQEGDGVTGRSYLTGLLWALETLAWDPAYFGRVVLVLGEMAARDPGGAWGNRPGNSLCNILLPWHPQTCAGAEQRSAAVAALLRDQPAMGWKLVLALLPGPEGVSMPTRRPAWRQSIPDDWTARVTNEQFRSQVETYATLALDAARHETDRLAELVGRWTSLPPAVREDLYTHLSSDTVTSLPPKHRERLWSSVVELVMQHRRFADAAWALEPALLDRLAMLEEKLAPTEPSMRHRRLFSERDTALFEERGNYQEQARELERKRQVAVAEIMAEGGLIGVVAFAQAVDSPWRVGAALGSLGVSPLVPTPSEDLPLETRHTNSTYDVDVTSDSRTSETPAATGTPLGGDADATVDAAILPRLSASEPGAVIQFSGGFVRDRFHRYGWAWVDTLEMAAWTPTALGQFFAFLPFVPDTWDRAERRLGDDAAEYWTRAAANPYDTEEGLDRAVDALLRHGRPQPAVDCLARMVHAGKMPEPATATRALLALVPVAKSATDQFRAVELITALQADPRTSEEELFSIEWAYLPLLTEHHGGTPKLLFARLATDPSFFCSLIRILYRPRGVTNPPGYQVTTTPSEMEQVYEPSGVVEKTEAARTATAASDEEREQDAAESKVTPAIAQNAYRLLREWRVPPGIQPDGEFDGTALSAWLDAVKHEATESGHLKVAMTRAGEVLTHVPPDPDGLWIHRAAAALLNARDADELRSGFLAQTINSRGVHWVDPTGKPEDELARQYRVRADDVEAAGYPRLASTLRDIAAYYTREADRIRTQDRTDL